MNKYSEKCIHLGFCCWTRNKNKSAFWISRLQFSDWMTHCTSNWLTGLRGLGVALGRLAGSCLHNRTIKKLAWVWVCFLLLWLLFFFNELGKMLKGLSSKVAEISFSQMPSKIFLEIRPGILHDIFNNEVIKVNIFFYFLLIYLRENLETLLCWIEIL